MEELWSILQARFGARARRNEPLARHTTLRLGGPADIWLVVEQVADLVEAVTLARRHQVPLFILGGGANLLIGDAGIRGLVIGNRARQVTFPAFTGQKSGRQAAIVAEGGAVLPSLARRCAKQGLSGLEWAVGVPGTIGGAVVNNAGAYDGDVAGQLVQAELLSPQGVRVWQPVSWFEYGYRRSRLKQQNRADRAASGTGWVVLRAELQMKWGPVADIEARTTAYNELRKASQPPGATIGSMFKNPPGDYAGRLIEAAGLKGRCCGQAQISPVHANFFQNLGGATAGEMMSLIEIAQTTVEEKFGVSLVLEIEVAGEFGKA